MTSVAVATFLIWLASVYVAAAHPESLAERVAPLLPVRKDTLGIAAFALSIASYAGQRFLADERSDVSRTWAVVLRTIRLYGAAVAAHVVTMGIAHPQTLSMRLTHLAPFPTEAVAGIGCACAAVAAHVGLHVLGWRDPGRSRSPGD